MFQNIYVGFPIICVYAVLTTCFSQASSKFQINRYFLQIDNIFEYKQSSFISSNTPESESLGLLQQPLDHFNPLEDTHFWQRYIFKASPEIRVKHSDKADAPICLFIGGDTAIQPWWVEEVFMAHACISEFNGYLFLLEHRFYGESIPSGNLTIDLLRYLTVAQALGDTASFIPYIRKNYQLEKNKLFVFGASYGGTLAALFRRKYPYLANAAVAMSAPMIRDYRNREYLPSIGRKIQNLDRKCYMLIEHGLRQSIRLMDTHVCATKDFPVCNVIRQNLGLCTSLNGMSQQERRTFYSTLIKDFTFLVEYDGILNVTVKNICDVITHPDIEDWSPMDKLLAGDIIISQELFRSKTRSGLQGECLQVKKQAVCDYLSNTNADHDAVISGKRQRLWQACTELASFRVSPGNQRQHPFGGAEVMPGSFQLDVCSCSFGERITEAFISERIRVYHESFGPFISPTSSVTGSRIIYSIGDEDPVLNRELKAVEKVLDRNCVDNLYLTVKGSAHCGEVFLRQNRKSEKATTQVQQAIVEQLLTWL